MFNVTVFPSASHTKSPFPSAVAIFMAMATNVSAQPDDRKDAYDDPLPPGAIARLGTARLRDLPYSRDLTPDGKTLIAGYAGANRMFEIATGREIDSIMPGGGGQPNDLAVSQDGKRLISAINGIRVWDVATKANLLTMGRGDHRSLAVSADGTRIAYFRYEAFGKDAGVRVFDIAEKKVVCRAPVNNLSPKVVISGNGKTLAIQHNLHFRNKVDVWDVDDSQLLRTIECKKDIGAIALSPDGKRLAVALWIEKNVELWSTDTGKLEHRFEVSEAASAVAFSPDGDRLAALDLKGKGALWRLKNFEQLSADLGRPTYRIDRIRFLPEGKLRILGVDSNSPVVFDEAGKDINPMTGLLAPVKGLQFSPDSRTLTSLADGGQVIVWDLTTNRPRSQIRRLGSYWPNQVTLDPTGQFALAEHGTWSEVFRLKEEEKILNLHQLGLVSFRGAFTADGTMFAASNDKNELQVYSTRTGKLVHSFAAHGEAVRSAALMPDGKRVAVISAADKLDFNKKLSLQIHEVATGKLLTAFEKIEVQPEGAVMAWSDDSKLILLGAGMGCSDHLRSRARLRIVDLVTQKVLADWPYSGTTPAVSADGQLIATAETIPPSPFDKQAASMPRENLLTKIVVRDLFANNVRHELVFAGGLPNSMAFSPDGRRLASGGDATAILLWDLENR